MRFAILSAAVLALAAGCAGVASLMSDAEIRPMGTGFVAGLSTSMPHGVYTLEHVKGRVLAAAATDPLRGAAINGRVPLMMNVNLRMFPEARECLRLRRPDGQLLAVGAPGQTQFRLPSLEAAFIQNVETPELTAAEREHARNVQVVADTQRWMAANPEALTAGQTCRVPLRSFGVCSTDRIAREAAKESCLASVVTCGSASTLADLATKWSTQNQGAASLVSAFTGGACSAAFDISRGDSVNVGAILRDLFVDVTAQALLNSLTQNNPSVEARLLTAATVAAIQNEFCLNDAVAQCRQQNAAQQRGAALQFQRCNQRMTAYRRAGYLLDTYRSPPEIRSALQARQARLKDLHSTSILQRTPAVLRVESCS